MAFIKGFQCFACGSSLGKIIRGSKDRVYCFVCCASRYDIIPMDHEMDGLNYEEMLSLIGVERGTAGEILARINTPQRGTSRLGKSGRNLILEGLYYKVTGNGPAPQSEDILRALDLYLSNLKKLKDDICPDCS